MNIYADRGNIAVLRARCEWRGLGFELSASGIDTFVVAPALADRAGICGALELARRATTADSAGSAHHLGETSP